MSATDGVRLVLSPVEPGSCRMRVDGAEVGHCLAWWDNRDPRNGAWQGYLWNVAGDSHGGWVTGPKALRLRELRALLEERLAASGAVVAVRRLAAGAAALAAFALGLLAAQRRGQHRFLCGCPGCNARRETQR